MHGETLKLERISAVYEGNTYVVILNDFFTHSL